MKTWPPNSVSVIIPTYNGQTILMRNLPSVIANFSQVGDDDFDLKHSELIIIDDASQDLTLSWLTKKFQLQLDQSLADQYGSFQVYIGQTQLSKNKFLSVKVIVNHQNLRFAATCNRAANLALGQFLWLLNNDVKPQPTALTKLLAKFNAQFFAVSCYEQEPNQTVGGKNKLWFNRGIFCHSRAAEFSSGPTAWASGGSALIDHAKWQQLGGFDVHYYPAYWEDVDLSTRAQKKGWSVIFAASAKVEHHHQSTNDQVFSSAKIAQLSYRQAAYFSWKNGNWRQKIQFLLWRPYWWKQSWLLAKKANLIWLAIILLAAGLRFYQLGQVPQGLTWDEAAIAYNGQAVIKTRRDEWLQFLPVSFRSFGDYKAPLAIYLSGIVTTLLNNVSPLAIRLPFAIAGVLAVVGMRWLTSQLLKYCQPKLAESTVEQLSWLAAAGLAISPWHLHFSRIGFESGLSLTLYIWGLTNLLAFLNRPIWLTKSNRWSLFWTSFFLVSALYAYHSAKIVIPLILGLSTILIWQKFHQAQIKNWGEKFLATWLTWMIGSSILAWPLIKDSVWGLGLSRKSSLYLFEATNLNEMISTFLAHLLTHFSPAFLFNGLTDSYRHGTGLVGVLWWPTAILLLGLIIYLGLAVIKKAQQPAHSLISRPQLKFIASSGLIIGCGLLPAILGKEVPQANRALLALPGFIWLAIASWQIILTKFKNLVRKVLISLLSLAYLISLIVYLKIYYGFFAQVSGSDFNAGCVEAMQVAVQYERQPNPEVTKILFTSDYGQPYIYALLVRKTSPIWYQGGSLIKYEFADKITDGDLGRTQTLIVASASDNISAVADQLVLGPAGEIRFKIYYPHP